MSTMRTRSGCVGDLGIVGQHTEREVGDETASVCLALGCVGNLA
jgi:hypothetical protein